MDRALWLVMTWYGLRGDPTTPERLSAFEFTRLCADAGLVDERRVLAADARIAFAAQLTKSGMRGKTLDFANFLEALRRVAVLATRAAAAGGGAAAAPAPDADRAFLDVVERLVLKRASRRTPADVSEVLGDRSVGAIFADFEPSLRDILNFYASPVVPGAAAAPARPASSAAPRAPRASAGHTGAAKKGLGLTLDGFLQFARDFHFSAVNVSLVDAAEAFLCVLDGPEARGVVRGVPAFWECIVRVALHAFRSVPHLREDQAATKIKGFLCHMWRTQSTRAVDEQRFASAVVGDFVSASVAFGHRFTALWQQDGFRDYLAPPREEPASALDVLRRAEA